ncbi:deleted in malignant brain tumors 1 protein-like [Liolophura sinensis]|uniref:deleted in malignant brain tumors 1 protein-like n=1 Tax=Liolophura sinensis TaxID=3198878 RepID=UPI0031593B13
MMWWCAMVLWMLVALWIPGTEGQSFQVRLVGGTNSSNGRVEVNNGVTWGTVCDDNWEDQDATIVCRMRGFSRGVALVSVNGVPPFGAGAGIIALDDVNCFGPEVNIAQCLHRGWGVHDCVHSEDAGVQCIGTPGNPIATTTRRPVTPGPVPDNCPGNQPSPNVRLYGTVTGIGIVEVFNSALNQWGSICDDGFGQRDAMVICRMLCYEVRYARAGARADRVQATPRLPIQLDNLGCTGNENDIFSCPSDGWGTDNCNDTTEAVRVTCIPQDYLAPPPPIPSVSCANALILASFNRTTYPDIEDKHLDVNNSPPNCNVRKRTTTTVAEIAIPFDECDTVKELNATHIVYKNTVRIASTYLQNNVYRKNTYLVYLACDFPRAGNVDDNGIQPLTESVSQRAPGQYNFQMTFYRNDNFTQAETVFPIRIPLGEFLNVGVSLEDVDTGLKLIVPNCRASPDLDPNSNVMYPLISERCPTDPALAVFPWNRTMFAFRFQTIRFLGNNPVFYVTCDTFVCTVNEKNADCDQSCETGSTGRRRRRRHVSGASHTMYHVVGGPFQVVTGGENIQQPPVHVHSLSTTPSGILITSPSPPLEPRTSGFVSPGSTPRVSYVTTLPHQNTWAPSTTQGARTSPARLVTTLAVRTATNGPSSRPSRQSTTSTATRTSLRATTSYPRRNTLLTGSDITSWTGRAQSVSAPTASAKTSQRTGDVNIIRVPQEAQSSSSISNPKAPSSESRAQKDEVTSHPNSQPDPKGEQRLFLPGEILGILDGSDSLRNPIMLVLTMTSLVLVCCHILF